ncbi:hypothetical protein BJX99DRAFT_257233 [Aspergillus californicus]
MQRSFYTILAQKKWKILEIIDNVWARPYFKIFRSALSIWTGGRWQNQRRLVSGFSAHNTQVREAAKARQRPVLEFQVQDGWAPLCKFLNKDQLA